MSILAQSGYGRSDKFEEGINHRVINGIIMSPFNERRERLEENIKSWGISYPEALILFDPQFYPATLNNSLYGHLNEYDYYKNYSMLGRAHFSGTRIQGYIKDCLDYQHQTFGGNLTYLISPTIIFDDFSDFGSQIALSFAVESADYHSALSSPKPLLISLVVSETAFNSKDAVDDFLDALTEIDTKGFYIILRRDSATIQNAMESPPFGRFMYFCHVLTTLNEYDVIVGYSDWSSFLLEAAGVTHTATGWYQNLRQFTLGRFQPSTGGKRPRKRYSSKPLLSCPLILPEMQELYSKNLLQHILSGSQYDVILQNGPASGAVNWSDKISCLAHWYSLNALSQRLSALPTQVERLDEAELILNNAMTLYTQLGHLNISFELPTGPNQLRELKNSLKEYRKMVRL
jgi:hypothetical protein